MWGIPLILTSTANIDPSQLIEIWFAGLGSGIVLNGASCVRAWLDSKFFSGATINSALTEPIITMPYVLAVAKRSKLRFGIPFLALKACVLLLSLNTMFCN